MTETPEETTTIPEGLDELLDALTGDKHSCVRVESRWYLEIDMPVNEDGEPIEASPEDAPGTKWMVCTGDFDRKEIERVIAFRQKQHPEDRIRLVRKDTVHVVEPLPTEVKI